MLCEFPYRKGSLELGCGRCEGCRRNRNRLWTGRMLLESYEHEFNCFVTLTYNERHVPWNGYLVKEDLQGFLKRLRLACSGRTIRYYGVGEYGEKSSRPHYHMVLFGVSPLEEVTIRKSWPYGFVHVGTAEAKSMSYVSSYIMKGWTKDNVGRLGDRPPEFSIMSLKPGIGMGVVERIVQAFNHHPTADKLSVDKMRTDGYKYPLGAYIKSKLRERLGITDAERGEKLFALVEELFQRKVQEGSNYHQKRKARILAGYGRIRRKEKVL
ncbi:MAG: replication initiator protein [Microviridae sp.]|nr:MAG: replication initiator protein [Microviridae sp.]